MKEGVCQICSKPFQREHLYPIELMRPSLTDFARKKYPNLDVKGVVCLEDLRWLRADYLQEMLTTERGELDSLDQEVVESLREYELVTDNINEKFEQKLTFGERIADKLAQFGGSWIFIFSFLGTMLLWMTINVFSWLKDPFDPYPFILLNLFLSCLAAIQAPVILMSQNRQASKDRVRDNDEYCINLKIELELRQLQSKMDNFVKKQWDRLLEIQHIQVELAEEILKRDNESNIERPEK